MQNGIDKVHDQLYIANITAARTHDKSDFDVVVTVCQDEIRDNVSSDVVYRHFNMADGETDMYGGKCNYDFFHTIAKEILQHLEDGDTIMVHCHAGQSRSASTSIAALAVYGGQNFYEMYNNVESQRPQIHPNEQLREYAIRFIEEETGISHKPSMGQ